MSSYLTSKSEVQDVLQIYPLIEENSQAVSSEITPLCMFVPGTDHFDLILLAHQEASKYSPKHKYNLIKQNLLLRMISTLENDLL